MQNIINEITEKLAAYENKAVDEYNAIIDTLAERDIQLEEHSHVLKTQHEALLKVKKSNDILLANEEALKKQAIAFKLESNSLKHLVNVAKKEIKALKEQVKRNQAAMKKRDAINKKLEKKVSGDAKLSELQTIYCKGDDVLIVYPTKLKLSFNGLTGEQVVLLYTDRRGCFVTGCLNEDNEVVFSSFISKGAKISEQTGRLINKNTLQVPDEVADFAQAWLYKVNVMQKMRIEKVDLICHK